MTEFDVTSLLLLGLLGYLMLDHFYTYIKYMISKYILYIISLNEPELIFFAHNQMVSLIAILYE